MKPRNWFCLLFTLALASAGGWSARAQGQLLSLDLPPKYAAPTAEFFLAAISGDLAALKQGLEEGVSVDATLPLPAPAALAVAVSPRSFAGKLLTDPGATALMFAAAAGRVEILDFLLDAKANVHAGTRSGTRALDIAAMRNDIPAMQTLLGVTPDSDAKRLSIVVDLASQRAVLSRDGTAVLTTRVSSGKSSKPTPRGTYVVTQKYTNWRSTLYNNASMPFFMRLSCSPVGLHQGVVPDYPASHGCVRLPESMARKFYAMVPRGTVVEIR
jgi:lipoprotein-anchoring transpeptidase ErfK/SrfK